MKTLTRKQRLLPRGVPRWVRCYDNGGTGAGNGISPGTIDRYTVCFTGKAAGPREHDGSRMALAMSAAPFHPQGFGQHTACIDVNKCGFAPALGRKNHLGTRIRFQDLPADCRKLVLRDYRELWNL